MSAIELSTRKDDQPKCSGVRYTQHWHPPDAFSESRERPRLTPPDFELDDGSGFESTLRRGSRSAQNTQGTEDKRTPP